MCKDEVASARATEARKDASGDRGKLLQDIFEVIEDYATTEEAPVVRLQTPEELCAKIDMTVQDGARSYDDLVAACREILAYSVKTGHPHFHNQLFAACKPAALCGEFVTAAANASMYTYEVAPVFTVMENKIIKKMYGFLGWGEGDGIFCPGGSMANFYGMNLARFQKCREFEVDVKKKGMRAAPHLVAYVSVDGHYSITKAAAFLGIGTDNVVKVASNDQGCMLPEALEAAMAADKAEGRVPFFIQATLATTVLGGCDDLVAIRAVADKFGAWLHVDGCWGGSVVLSKTHRHLAAGVEKVDSFSWNPHKMMGVPLQCAAFLTQHLGLLQEAHAANAKYLFQKDKLNTNLDTGDKSVQCGRKVDVLKLWMAWAATGDRGYEAHIDNIMDVARHLRDEVVRRDEFLLVAEPMCTNVCFWFVPPSLRAAGAPARGTPEWRTTVHQAAAKVKERMQAKGSLMVGFQSIPLASDPEPANFFRMVVMAEDSNPSGMDFLLDEIALLGSDL
jgi:glutamate/tyrosine decarboxylase-like PLP-dependent enzyme